MKKTTLFKTVLLLCALIVGSLNGWADEVTWDLSKKTYSTGSNWVTWSSDYVTMTNSSASGGTSALNYLGGDANKRTSSRFYSGNTLTITPTSDYSISSIVFTATSESYATALQNSTWTNATAVASSTTVTVTPENGENVCSASIGGTCGFSQVVVTYSSSDTRTAVNINSLTFDPTSLVVGSGLTSQATAGHDTQACTTATFTYESLDEKVATCTSEGVITAVAKGTVGIKATMSIPNDDPAYRVGTATITQYFTVTNPTHNAIFMANGVQFDSKPVEEGESITFPASNPGDKGGKTFVGWLATEIDGTTNVKPSFVTSAKMGNADQTYYAVFATENSSITTTTDDITLGDTEVSGSAYVSWNNISLTTDAVYAGNNAGGNDAIQLRSGTSKGSSVHSGIVSTTSGGKVKKITVVWNSNTADDRTLDIYGKNAVYASVEDLYSAQSATQGTKLGSIVKGTSTELTVTGDYTYVGLRSNDGAMYFDKISIDWESGSVDYSDYCTSIVETATVTSVGWATFSSDYALDFTDVEGLEAYMITGYNGANIVKSQVKGTVPANTGLLLKGAKGNYVIPVVGSSSTDVSANKMVAGTGASVSAEAGKTKYVLGVNGSTGKAEFQKIVSTSATVPAGKAYLLFNEEIKARALQFDEGETTAISEVRGLKSDVRGEFYNLNGQRVAQPSKGLYIVNGKKVMFK